MSSPGSNGFLGDAMYKAHFGDRNPNDGATGAGVPISGGPSRFFGLAASAPGNAMTPISNNGVMPSQFSSCLYVLDSHGVPTPVYYAANGAPAQTGSAGGMIIPNGGNGTPLHTATPPSPSHSFQQQIQQQQLQQQQLQQQQLQQLQQQQLQQQQLQQQQLQQQQAQAPFVMNLGDGPSFPYVPVLLAAHTQSTATSPLLTSGSLQSRSNSPHSVSEGNPSPLLVGIPNTSGCPSVQMAAPPFGRPAQTPSFAQHFSASPFSYGAKPSASAAPGCEGMRPSSAPLVEHVPGSPGGSTGEPLVEVYAPDFTSLLSLPAAAIAHQPPSTTVSRLVLCRKYVPGRPDSCWKGEMCRFVHADAVGATRSSVHVNYAWRSVERCTYPRLPPGESLSVLAPNERQPSEMISSERVLVTRGSANRKTHVGPLSHCAHYYFNRLCNRGENCNFIHAVHVDPTVTADFKRAPAPISIAPIKRRGSRTMTTTPSRETLEKGGATHTTSSPCESINASFHAPSRAGAESQPVASGLFLVVPPNASRSLSPVAAGSMHSSVNSGTTHPMEWSFVDNLDSSAWSQDNNHQPSSAN